MIDALPPEDRIETVQLIRDNIGTDVGEFVLRNSGKIPKKILKFAAEQIESRKKAKNKIACWYENYDIVFPKPISVEQSSSEAAARYKSELVEGNAGADLTAGFGVDAYCFSKRFKRFFYNEINIGLSDTVAHNFRLLGVDNTRFSNFSAEIFLKQQKEKLDFVFIDPGRRDSSGKKTVLLQDCSPDVTRLIPLLKEKTKQVMVKTSPLLDISSAIDLLGESVSQVHAVASSGECKELLFLCDFTKNIRGIPYIAANLDFDKAGIVAFSGNRGKIEGALPEKYIYEPNPAMMKLGFWKEIELKYAIRAISPNTHLYTSGQIVSGFPGRIFSIDEEVGASKKEIQKALPEGKANIITRNYPIDSATIARKFKIADGGEAFILAFRDNAGKNRLFSARKIRNDYSSSES